MSDGKVEYCPLTLDGEGISQGNERWVLRWKDNYGKN
jgi:hypothetical protein